MLISGTNFKIAGASLISVCLSACIYGFAGGGLPSNIRTVAIIPIDNLTAEPALTQESTEAIRDALEGRLGLRLSAEETADAVVTGTILSYEPDIPLSFRQGVGGQVDVTQRRVQITLRVEIFDRVEERILWERSRIVVDGEYDPPNEANGRQKALEKLVNDIVDGAQSQW
jgi:hypothetical protein